MIVCLELCNITDGEIVEQKMWIMINNKLDYVLRNKYIYILY